MDQLPTASPPTLPWDSEAGTPGHVTAGSAGRGWPVFLEAVAPVTVLVALCGVAGNGAVAHLLCSRAHGSPHAAYILHLAAADILGLSCTALTVLEAMLVTPRGAAPHAAALLEPLSGLADTAELGLLAALGLDRLLCGLRPARGPRPSPRRASAVVRALTWALAAAVHVAAGVCGSLGEPRGCDGFHAGVGALHLLLCAVMALCGLALTARGLCCPPPGASRGLRHAVGTVLASFLLWGLPAVVVGCLLGQEDLRLTLDLLLLLSSAVGAVHLAVYFFAGYLGNARDQESLSTAFQRAVMRDLEAGRSARETRPRGWE
ncbi:mas-related G-protein coupled receptor MRG-like [Dasypus novemcinctus]|uniref:mas-related G-protein coupled receptor MRG-like n=1 Tax=Dasypus novemcinctus TaxID=9361 RepID=UPI00265F1E89|nr:mas-related G-protein coupled receptor MRG-like [Dasypus novemcinctus]